MKDGLAKIVCPDCKGAGYIRGHYDGDFGVSDKFDCRTCGNHGHLYREEKDAPSEAKRINDFVRNRK